MLYKNPNLVWGLAYHFEFNLFKHKHNMEVELLYFNLTKRIFTKIYVPFDPAYHLIEITETNIIMPINYQIKKNRSIYSIGLVPKYKLGGKVFNSIYDIYGDSNLSNFSGRLIRVFN